MAKIANNKQIRQRHDHRMKQLHVQQLQREISDLVERQERIADRLGLEYNDTRRRRMNATITMISKHIDSIQQRIRRNQ